MHKRCKMTTEEQLVLEDMNNSNKYCAVVKVYWIEHPLSFFWSFEPFMGFSFISSTG